MTGKPLLAAMVAVGIAVRAVGAASAQPYPDRPVKIVIPFPPGGPTELNRPLVADRLRSPEAQAGLARLSARARIGSPQDFTAFIAAETPRWAAIAAETGIKVD